MAAHDVTEREFFDLLGSNKTQHLCYDIETRPAPDDVLRKFFDKSKIELPSSPGKFDSNTVAVGNLKDPDKIEAKILTAQNKHWQMVEAWTETCRNKRDTAWEVFKDRAPLSSLYGEVCAVGYGATKGPDVYVWLDISPDEELLLVHFWQAISHLQQRGGKLLGHNSDSFDLPFITRRGWKYGLKPPKVPYLMTKYGKTPDWVVDTMRYWGFGGWKEYVKLDDLARMLGVEGKLEGVDGSMFWKLLRDGDLETAHKYLRRDITTLHAISDRMGIV